MTYNLTKKDKEFARWLVEQLRANDPVDRKQEFDAFVVYGLGGTKTVSIRFGRRGKSIDFPKGGGVNLIEALVGEYLLLPTEKGITFKATNPLFDLVDRDFTEHNPLDDDKKVLRWLVEEQKAGHLNRRFLAAEWSDGPGIAHYSGDIIKEFSLAVLDSLESLSMLQRNPADGHGWWYTLLPAAYEAVESDFGAAAQSVTRSAQSTSSLNKVNQVVLLQLIDRYFNDEELQTLCFELEGVKYENVKRDGITATIRNLIQYMDRNGRLLELVIVVQEKRPNIDWSPLFKN